VSISREIQAELKRFGANVRRERVARQLTQERFAELVDLNIRTVQKIEAGKLNILLTTLLRIQRALNCPWSKLLMGKE
jgi:transcriptional regulator with XRE-family HTH domain